MLSYKGVKIRKRVDGRYEARTCINKKRIYIYGKTQKECYEKLKRVLNDENKLSLINKQYSLKEFYQLWYNHKEKLVSEGSLKNIRSIFKNYVFTKLDYSLKLNDIKLSSINDCILSVDKLRMREYCSQYLKDLFYFAFVEKYIKVDISSNIVKFTKAREEGRALTKEQRKLVIEKSDFIGSDIFIFYLFSGCRKSELLNIKKSDVLYENNVLHIPGTKTRGSNRYIPLFDVLDNIIKGKECKENDYIYNISDSTIKRKLNKLKKYCGFDFTIKDLRTTFGTMCAEMGISNKVIAKWMGHTSEKTTSKYYIKVLTEFEKEQKQLFDSSVDHNFDPKK